LDWFGGGSLGKLSIWKNACAVSLVCSATATLAAATTFTTLVNFDPANGGYSNFMSLAQGLDGDFYGTNFGGGANGQGAVFKVSSEGALTTLYSFCPLPNCPDGQDPEGGLVLGTDGDFYGTTAGGGSNGWGTIFKITAGGSLTTLYSFCAKAKCADGVWPFGGLVQATDGNFYGTTQFGGAYFGSGYISCGSGCGTVFKLTPEGKLTTLYSFCAQVNCADGAYPVPGILQATNGNFYGATQGGGNNGACENCGTIFEITSAGALTTLHTFGLADGKIPFGALVQATDGNLYGTTASGGANDWGEVFKITPTGTLTTLYSFGGTDGGSPYAPLAQATNGSFYGTTFLGGGDSEGTVFKMTLTGKVTTLHRFDGTDGSNPSGALLQATNGEFYGTTSQGGSLNAGTAFSMAEGLRPFVNTVPRSGKVGSVVVILGTNLTSATGVSFGGKPAKFTVVSSSEITTTVPEGAKTGPVKVATASGALKSSIAFRVEP
jgi:uncharacterized repeat protein (TIGR03803 family)